MLIKVNPTEIESFERHRDRIMTYWDGVPYETESRLTEMESLLRQNHHLLRWSPLWDRIKAYWDGVP